MAQTIVLRRSAQPGKIPGTGSLNLGEVAINTYDGKLFFAKSGSIQSIEQIVTTNSITSGSINIIGTGSFGELIVTRDIDVTGSIYVVNDIVGNGDLDVLGSVSGSALRITGTGSFESLQVNDTLTVNHGTTIISGSQLVTSDLTVLGQVNARQFNISVISSSVLFQSGSTKFGDTSDDRHSFTGSVSISGSFLVNGTEVGVAAGPNTFDFNLDPEAAGTVNFIEDSTGNTQAIARTGSFDVVIGNTTRLSVSASAMNVTSQSVTRDFMHLVKYITTAGDLDFNI
jgi:hypothetical protein